MRGQCALDKFDFAYATDKDGLSVDGHSHFGGTKLAHDVRINHIPNGIY